jgi:hypothetical protein
VGFVFLATSSGPALGLTQPPIQWILKALKPGGGGGERPGREADRLTPSSAEVKNAWSYTSTSQYVFMTWWFIKHERRLNGVVLS